MTTISSPLYGGSWTWDGELTDGTMLTLADGTTRSFGSLISATNGDALEWWLSEGIRLVNKSGSSVLVRIPISKHLAGQHDQSTHGNWATNTDKSILVANNLMITDEKSVTDSVKRISATYRLPNGDNVSITAQAVKSQKSMTYEQTLEFFRESGQLEERLKSGYNPRYAEPIWKFIGVEAWHNHQKIGLLEAQESRNNHGSINETYGIPTGTAKINQLMTHPDFRRMGVATAMFLVAQKLVPIPFPKEQTSFLPDGAKWSDAVWKHYTGQHDQSTHGNWAHGTHNKSMAHDFHEWPEYKSAVSAITEAFPDILWGGGDDNAIAAKVMQVASAWMLEPALHDAKTMLAELVLRAQDEAAKMENFDEGAFNSIREGKMPLNYTAWDGTTSDMRKVWVDAVMQGAVDDAWSDYRYSQLTEEEKGDFKNTTNEVNVLREEGKVCVAIGVGAAGDILNSEVFLNQFDAGYSNGLFHPTVRSAGEARAMAIPTDAESKARPIYGYVADNDTDAIAAEDNYDLKQYGPVRFVLKDSVKDRTTMTMGDSLNLGAKPIPMRGKVSSKQIFKSFVAPNRNALGGDPDPLSFQIGDLTHEGYAEAQIFGKLALSDVEKVVLLEENPHLEALFTEKGIPTEVVAW